MKKEKLIFLSAFGVSVAVAIAHLIWLVSAPYAVYAENLLLSVIPYGLPILIFAILAFGRKRELKDLDWAFGGGFAVMALVMYAHVTIAGIVGPFIDAYFNIPVLYGVLFAVIALVWLIVRTKPNEGDKKVLKVLYYLPLIALAVMVANTLIVGAVELITHSMGTVATSAPWWVMPLIVAVCYLPIVLLLYVAYWVARGILKHKP